MNENAARGPARAVNTYASAFFSDYVIPCEDDILFAKDALKFFEWAYDEYHDVNHVFSVCGYNRVVADSMPAAEHHRVVSAPWFTPWGWATWQDRFADIKATLANRLHDYDSWDCIVNQNIRKDRLEVKPMLARTQNIGAENAYRDASKLLLTKNCDGAARPNPLVDKGRKRLSADCVSS